MQFFSVQVFGASDLSGHFYLRMQKSTNAAKRIFITKKTLIAAVGRIFYPARESTFRLRQAKYKI